jgi:hypothetical protein
VRALYVVPENMKKRAELESDKWNTTQDSIEFSLGGERVAIIRAIDNSLEASVAGFEAPMRVRKITLIDDMEWLFLDFEESCELHRLALCMRYIPYAALNSDLLTLLAGMATPYFRQHRSEKNKEEAHNKPHHPTARSRSVDMISRNYNLNPVIDFRPNS